MFAKKNLNNQLIIVFSIFFISLSIRFFGLNWDQNQHLHPDERFLTMLVSTIQFPSSVGQYFDTKNSPLNPFNYQDFHFFVYGTFPLFLVKSMGFLFNVSSYENIHFIGRILSAIFDSLNIFSLYFLAKLIFPKNKKNLLFLPGLFYCFTVLPIQLSHFFAVDTFLSFFILLTFVLMSYWLKTNNNFLLLFASITFGLSMSCKISAILLAPIIFLFFLYHFRQKKIIFLIKAVFFVLFSLIIFRIFQPYSFIGIFKINPDFINSLNYLKSILLNKDVFYPPEIQWLTKTPVLFPLQNIILFGLGLPISITLLVSVKNIFSIKFKRFFLSHDNFIIFLASVWVIFVLIQQGLQFTSTMRYFLPIYPFICLLAVFFNLFSKKHHQLFILTFIFHLIYCILFLSIYTKPHTRVQASDWIYKNIPKSSTIANEYWDDALPLSLDYSSLSFYINNNLPLYDPDTEIKWQKINSILNNTDYIFLTSNRLWSSITQIPRRYPITTEYYQELFDGNSQFKKIMEFNSYPGISLPILNKCIYFGPTNFPYLKNKNHWVDIDSSCKYPGIYFRDDISEEAFSVYDHPKVILFKKMIN
ncbi:MAG: glycosyltransferase family 39 protein [Candidatus Shapirobacteria bacterium]|jgi:hypothetical protein